LSHYVTELLRWNASSNLVGPCTPEEAVERHVVDSLALLRLLDRPEVGLLERPWFDVGSGAGVPGLVLAASRPEMALHIVEPRGRRATFCKQVASALGLGSVQVHQERLEDLEIPAGSGAMSRATFAPEIWAQRGAESVGPEGLVVVMMGAGAPQIVTEAAWLLDRLALPASGHTRVNAILRGR
jgi:16S rRNA (guanine527-N7)-methyltransferase